MPRLLSKPAINPGAPLVVRRPFTANGRRYSRGDVFPWRRLAIDFAKVRRMYENNYLEHAGTVQPVVDEGFSVPAETPAPMEEYVPAQVNNDAPAQVSDDLDAIEDLGELRTIADEVGAPYRRSKAEQREAIREARANTDE